MPLDWLRAELERLAAEGLLRPRRRARLLPDGWCELDGRKLRNFASNDYLNLALDPRVVDAAAQGYCSALIANAREKPAVVNRPTSLPPCSNASGIIVSASIVRIAPPAKDRTIAIVCPLAPSSSA